MSLKTKVAKPLGWMDGCRPVSRAGRADEAGKPSVSIPTAHAAQTGRVDRDTETGTQIHTP